MVRETVLRGDGVGGRPFPVDSPRRRGRPKTKQSEIERDATIGVLSTAVSAIFIPLSIPLGPHWLLSDEEANTIGESLQKALSTLPNNHYADLKKYLDRFVPWVALVLTVGQVVAPKIEETQRRRAERGAEEFPPSIEVPAAGYVDPSMRQRPDVAGNGSQAGRPDPFGAFPGAD